MGTDNNEFSGLIRTLTGNENISVNVLDGNPWQWQINSSESSSRDQIFGNVIVGNGEWIVNSDSGITPDRISSEVKDSVGRTVDFIIDKLRRRLPLEEADKSSSDGNPFADGKNPFGEGEFEEPPAYKYLKSVYGENFPLPSGEGSGTSENLSTGTNNPFANLDNPGAGGTSANNDGANPQQSSDILNIIFGSDGNKNNSNSLPFLNGAGNASNDGNTSSLPTLEVLENIQDGIKNFTTTVKSESDNLFTGGNKTPLKTPSDLLTLFKNDMFSFNSGLNAIGKLVSDQNASNPFTDLFKGDIEHSQIPFDVINVALDGLLPFNGSDNVFQTKEGEIPIGYGNRDFGSNNAVIGNANWDYGNSNATIGNGNWHWDGSTDNATIGNGNWHLDLTDKNKTIGNGNWYWNSSDDNTTLGNGNWHFGDNNTTIGNGNWDFGNNNTIIGNGNWVFTNNSIVVGNGNWSVVIDKSSDRADELLNQLDTLVLQLGIKDATDSLVNTLMSGMGEIFMPLTKDNVSESGMQTYNNLFLS